jgi:hypothetical protein
MRTVSTERERVESRPALTTWPYDTAEIAVVAAAIATAHNRFAICEDANLRRKQIGRWTT